MRDIGVGPTSTRASIAKAINLRQARWMISVRVQEFGKSAARDQLLTALGQRSARVAFMLQVRSCGLIIFRRTPELSFLLMKHAHRFDLPKGHMEPGETEIQTALRETWEETGIASEQIKLDPEFRYEETYFPVEPRFGTERVEKTLVIFLGWISQNLPIAVTEHLGHEWKRWHPPHDIQRFTINPLLIAILKHFETHPLPND